MKDVSVANHFATVLREEIVLGMQLLGVSRLEQLTAERIRIGDGKRRAARL